MSLSIAMLLHKSVVHDSRVRREASALVEAGYDVTVIELDPQAHGRLDGFRRASASPPAWVRRALPFHVYRVAFLAAFLARIVRLRPDVVHAHDAAMLLPGLVGARVTGARLVYDSHELATGVPYRDRGWQRFVEWIERLAVPRAAEVITVSDGVARRLEERYALSREPTVVRNVSALPARRPSGALREALAIGDAPLVLHQGAAAVDRGCETLVRAMSELPGVRLVFLGDGDPGFDERLARVAAALGLAERVQFHHSVPVERLLAYTGEADVGVTLLEDTCENHRLALPNKLFEYVAAGVPVVASDLPELGAFVRRHRVGWLVDASDPRSVAAGLRNALVSRGDAGLASRLERARRSITWAEERGRLAAVYVRLASAGPHLRGSHGRWTR